MNASLSVNLLAVPSNCAYADKEEASLEQGKVVPWMQWEIMDEQDTGQARINIFVLSNYGHDQVANIFCGSW